MESSGKFRERALPPYRTGYNLGDYVTLMSQYGVLQQSAITTISVHQVTFSDGSSGYYTTEQIVLMQQYGIH